MEIVLTETIMANFDERQQKTIAAALEYAKDPYGDVAHNLKVIVAKLAEHVIVFDNIERENKTPLE